MSDAPTERRFWVVRRARPLATPHTAYAQASVLRLQGGDGAAAATARASVKLWIMLRRLRFGMKAALLCGSGHSTLPLPAPRARIKSTKSRRPDPLRRVQVPPGAKTIITNT